MESDGFRRLTPSRAPCLRLLTALLTLVCAIFVSRAFGLPLLLSCSPFSVDLWTYSAGIIALGCCALLLCFPSLVSRLYNCNFIIIPLLYSMASKRPENQREPNWYLLERYLGLPLPYRSSPGQTPPSRSCVGLTTTLKAALDLSGTGRPWNCPRPAGDLYGQTFST